MISLFLAAAVTSTTEIPAVRDNTIYSESADASNGQGVDVFTGRTLSANLRRALLAFDLTGVPAGSVVHAATLHLTLTLAPPFMETHNVALHRLTAGWGEAGSNAAPPGGTGAPAEKGDATWEESFYRSTAWTTAGGDFAASPSAVIAVGFESGAVYAWGSTATIADVQAWVDNPATNHGWILVGDEGASGSAKRFASGESTTVTNRPRLVVEYTAPPAGPGGVPDGGMRPGIPLTLGRSGTTLSLTWSASCRPAADYAVQAGTLAALRTGTFDDSPLDCTTGGQTSYTVSAPAASSYFLVLPLDGGAAGSRGLDGDGAERALGTSACAPASTAAPVCP